jgi:DNA-binding LacI/PurR family transcriptional regulator
MMIPAIGPASQWSAKLMDGRIDACIVTDPTPEDLEQVAQEIDLPMLGINLNCEGDFSHIRYNEAQGVALIMDHLLELGHRRIWLAAHDHPRYKSLEHISFVTRMQTLQRIMTEHNLMDQLNVSIQPISDLADQIQAMPVADRPTAIIGQTDSRAMELIQELDVRQIKVPDDISVVGFNNDNSSQFFVPALTTIDLPVNQAADTAVQYLFDHLQNPSNENEPRWLNLILDEKLIVRRSTTKVRS